MDDTALVIHASGVVLRSEGQDEAGTVIVATGAIQRDFILANGLLSSGMGTGEAAGTCENKGDDAH